MCRRTDIGKKISSNISIVHTGFEINGIASPCHLWTGSDSGDGRGGGYPRMSLDGQTVAVHIVAFTNKNGFVPGKKQIDHMCNQRRCVNEDHLQMVTHKRNQKLRIQRSRKASNAASPQHCQLPSADAPVYDRRGSKIPENTGVLVYAVEGFEECLDGRYLPDHAFWQTSPDVRSASLHSASNPGES